MNNNITCMDVVCLNSDSRLCSVNCRSNHLIDIVEGNEMGMKHQSSLFSVVCSLFLETDHPLTIVKLSGRPTYRLAAMVLR